MVVDKITMEQRVKIVYTKSPTGRRFQFSGNPIAAMLILCALLLLSLFVITAIDFLWDQYFPYEGKVLKIETRWYDYITFEFMTWEHVMIETPDGKTVDKLVSTEIRLPNRIKVGDYVVKQKGFRNAIRPRDKKTTDEILEEWSSHGKGGNQS